MSPDAKKKLIGALVVAALAIAVYYGLIDQKQADSIRTQADQTLGTGPAAQQQTPQPAPQQVPQHGPATTQNATTPAPAAPAPQKEPPSPRQ